MSTPPGGRLPHLDGIRGVAILLVLAGHSIVKVGGAPGPVTALLNSDLGVLMFFVLSGYLITGILLREHQATGAVSLRRFYARRTLRIFPAFYVMVAVMLILAAVTRTVDISAPAALFSGFYLVNYSPVPIGWWLGHLWSLAIEEQFYLLWPVMLLLLRPHRALAAAAVVIVAAPFVRVTSYILFPALRDRIPVFLHTRADALLIGAAVALVAALYPVVFARVVDVVARHRLAGVAVVALVLSSLAQQYLAGAYMLPVGYSANAVAVAILIIASTRAGGTRAVLSWRPLVAVGVISYSLYLWQQVFLAHEWRSGVMANLPACLAFTFLVALASRIVVENPALRLKARFEPAVVDNRIDARAQSSG